MVSASKQEGTQTWDRFKRKEASKKMLDNKGQSQTVAQNATAIQSSGNVTIVNKGLSLSEVREVALDLFNANFFRLAGVASEVAKERATEVTDDFLKKLQLENAPGISEANDPDFQHGLFTVQRVFARSGDHDLEAILLDLLIERSKRTQRSLIQIVLNESLETAAKLTQDQIAALSLIFYIRYTNHTSVVNRETFGKYFDKCLLPFTQNACVSPTSYQHMQYAGCGSVSVSHWKLSMLLGTTYKGLFQKGTSKSDALSRGISETGFKNLFIPRPDDATLFDVRAMNSIVLDALLPAQEVAEADQGAIRALFEQSTLSEDAFLERCISIRPSMQLLFDLWEKSDIKHFTLTSVGIAIAHANAKRIVGESSDLSIWIK